MAEQFLHCADVDARSDQEGCEGVSTGVQRDAVALQSSLAHNAGEDGAWTVSVRETNRGAS